MINKIIRIFSGMSGHPEGHDRATQIFWQKLKLLKLKKMHRVAYDLERLFENFSHIFGQPEGRGRAMPIFSQKLKLDIYFYFFASASL